MLKKDIHKVNEFIKSRVLEIKQLVGKGEMKKALEKIKELPLSAENYDKEFLVLQNRFTNLSTKINQGIINESDRNIENNNIVISLLDLLSRIEKSADKKDYQESSKKGKSKFWLLILSISVVAFLSFLIIAQTTKISSLNFIFILIIILISFAKIFLPKPRVKPFKLVPSYKNGLYGGLIGGTIAGLILAITYAQPVQSNIDSEIEKYEKILDIPDLAPSSKKIYQADIERLEKDNTKLRFLLFGIVGFSIIVGATFFFMHAGMSCFLRFKDLNENWAILLGAVSGGALIGAVDGMVGAMLFVELEFDEINKTLIAIAGGIGSVAVIIGTLYYSYKGNWWYITFSLIASVVVTVFLSIIGAKILKHSQLNHLIDFTGSLNEGILSGAILGAFSGVLFALIISLTIVFYHLRKYEQKQEEASVKLV